MAAILPFLETESMPFTPAQERAFMAAPDAGLDGLGKLTTNLTRDVRAKGDIITEFLASSHSELTALLWTRRLIERAVRWKDFREEQPKVPRKFWLQKEGRDWWIYFDEPLPTDVVPWNNLGKPLPRVSLLSTNSKMASPTWDLPAGAADVGGACPGARAAQSTSMPSGEQEAVKTGIVSNVGGRFVLKTLPDVGYSYARSVCSRCYATGGKYGGALVQAAEVTHLLVVQTFLETEQGAKQFRDVMADAVLSVDYESADFKRKDENGNKVNNSLRLGIKPVRVHSSGDFFSTKYAKWWMEVANRVGKVDSTVVFWAPTRTHALDTWVRAWPEITKALKYNNFSIRPSAYHIGDAAPPKMPGLTAQGTSVLFPADTEASKGRKYDWNCQTYSAKNSDATCAVAEAPDGQSGCRACWIHRDTRVNYVAH